MTKAMGKCTLIACKGCPATATADSTGLLATFSMTGLWPLVLVSLMKDLPLEREAIWSPHGSGVLRQSCQSSALRPVLVPCLHFSRKVLRLEALPPFGGRC